MLSSIMCCFIAAKHLSRGVGFTFSSGAFRSGAAFSVRKFRNSAHSEVGGSADGFVYRQVDISDVDGISRKLFYTDIGNDMSNLPLVILCGTAQTVGIVF
jgi:hypothetical protein